MDGQTLAVRELRLGLVVAQVEGPRRLQWGRAKVLQRYGELAGLVHDELR